MTEQPEAAAAAGAKLVVVGSSAGGIEALSRFVSAFPVDFPAPVVLAQHLDPSHPSHLAEILQRRSPLPVVGLTGATRLAPGTIYVVPANRHVSIHGGSVALDTDHANRPRPSVDLLLSTAAEAYGENLVAVILTGSGTDGAIGAVDVSQAGGTVIIQNPQTALYPSMPLALPPAVIDYVAELEAMGPLLMEIVQGRRAPGAPTLLEDPLHELLGAVTRRTGIDFRPYKASTILRRIGRRLSATGTSSLRDYIAYLGEHPAEVEALVAAFLIKVTEFFRDPEAFVYLQRTILPQLIERGRERGRVLRIWSAGCARGEEAYSIAMLIAEHLGTELPDWNVKIFATDLDNDAISLARRGVYSPELLANVPDMLRARYFEPADGALRVVKPLRQMVIFGQQDISRGTPFPRIDLAVCRNLLIYFQPELQQHVLDIFAYSLHAVEGFLFLGRAETVRPSNTSFELTNKRWKIYRCIAGGFPLQRRHGSLALPGPAAAPSGQRDEAAAAGAAPGSLLVDRLPAPARLISERLLRALPAGVVVIDHAYRIQVINVVARRILGILETDAGRDLLHMARDLPYNLVRGAIDNAVQTHTTQVLSEIELDPRAGGESRYVSLTVVPFALDLPGAELLVLSLLDVTDQMQTRRQLQAAEREQAELLRARQEANARLNALNQALQTANEQLQATNEALMLGQEELQATAEEYEATNEELQAVNEELETNNEELQATNEELQATTEEMGARTSEMTAAWSCLAEMVDHAPFGILLLRGADLLVAAVNQPYLELTGVRDIVGKPLATVWPGLGASRAGALIRDAYRRGIAQTSDALPGPDRAGPARFIYAVTPVHDGADTVTGVVVYLSAAGEAPGTPA